MKKRLLILVITLVCLAMIAGKISELSIIPVYKYGSLNTEFQFACYPSKGRTIESMQLDKVQFDKRNNVSSVICRKFPKNYLKIWNLSDYWLSPYYQFPFCE